jgi:spore germination cell wall hydrolase CwlJ-like protein
MNRTVRAAGLAAAAVAFAAAATFSAPSMAGEAAFTPEIHFSAHGQASLDDVDQALNGVDAEVAPAEAKAEPEQKSVFAQLWSHAVTAIVGESREDEKAPRIRSLDELVTAYSEANVPNREQDCLANAVYFEARGEPIEGQLAVAEVVLNRASSGKYPTDICGVVTQPWQFSFVNATGRIPAADRSSESWRKAVAIAHIAREKLADTIPSDVLWYHATYVSPSWGRRLNRQTQIGLHIFYS